MIWSFNQIYFFLRGYNLTHNEAFLSASRCIHCKKCKIGNEIKENKMITCKRLTFKKPKTL